MRARLLLRQATSSFGASVVILLVVAVAAGLFTAWPRVQRATFVDELNYRIAGTGETARDLRGSTPVSSPVSLNRSYASAYGDLQAVVDGAGPALAPRLGDPELLLTFESDAATPLVFSTSAPEPTDLNSRLLTIRAIGSFTDHVTFVEGEAPERWRAMELGVAASGPLPIALSRATADRVRLGLGDELSLDQLGGLRTQTGTTEVPTAVVVGIFEATDPGASYWEHQPSALEPRIIYDPNVGEDAVAAAYVHPESAPALTLTSSIVDTSVWVPVSPGADDARALLDDLREITARSVEFADQGFVTTSLRLSSALVRELEAAIAAERGTTAVLTMAAAGPVGVMFALLALATRLSISRRRDTLALARARGGSAAVVRAALGVEGLALGLPVAVLGAAVATGLVPGALVAGDYLLALLAGLAPAVLLASAALPNLRTQRSDLSTRGGSRWRWVAEAAVVGVAAGAVYVLATRGVRGADAGVDPLTTSTPLLLSVAAAILAHRVYPVPMRGVHALTRRTRGLGDFLGSARAVRDRVAGLVPLIALLVATSIAVFSTTMLTTLTGGVDDSTAAGTGADVRLAGPSYTAPTVAEISAIEGVESVAAVYTEPTTTLTVDGEEIRLVVHAVDTAALATVQADVEGAVTLPDDMGRLRDGAVPMVLPEALSVDADAEMTLAVSTEIPVVLAGTTPGAAGIADGEAYAVVDLDLVREETGRPLVPRMLLVSLTPDADEAAAIASMTEAVGGVGTIATQESTASTFLDSPSARSMQQGMVVALAVSALQSALAIVLALVLAAPARGRLIAVLRTLGARPREARRLVSWELVPVAVTAIVVGTGLGLALPHLVVATVDLSTFTGQRQVAVGYDWPLVGLVLAGVVLMLAITLLMASAIARRLSLTVLRIGDAT